MMLCERQQYLVYFPHFSYNSYFPYKPKGSHKKASAHGLYYTERGNNITTPDQMYDAM